ncbi:hypothetical protein M441DRAFT_417611 [Trichoderma asperellum CBS 433.97]|uniref:Uncharacterized protein n=1 Tax=Trichoderma asperellum (strain ATCC 204424 / CBS 433.97 / NBRC 101777) TaxID=1042311 RepID=A0A2T3Z8F4_TRIA4|nr:hypothetical protein M441DRAFT_417611 [Trichoderma asperellum CBS 433.97]PTB41099.1 hypothetical protein M441DRAFT_417611 [Trichoderma asperellum CBS 433.97]
MGDFVARLNLVANLGWRFLRAPASPCSHLTSQPCRLEQWRSFLGGRIPYSCFEMSPRGPLRSFALVLVLCALFCDSLNYSFPGLLTGEIPWPYLNRASSSSIMSSSSLALPFLSLICTPYPMSCLSAFQRAQ